MLQIKTTCRETTAVRFRVTQITAGLLEYAMFLLVVALISDINHDSVLSKCHNKSWQWDADAAWTTPVKNFTVKEALESNASFDSFFGHLGAAETHLDPTHCRILK